MACDDGSRQPRHRAEHPGRVQAIGAASHGHAQAGSRLLEWCVTTVPPALAPGLLTAAQRPRGHPAVPQRLPQTWMPAGGREAAEPCAPRGRGPQAGAGVVHSDHIQGQEKRSRFVRGPTEWSPQQLFLQMARTFQRRAAGCGGSGRALKLRASLQAQPNERDFRCKPGLPAPVEGSGCPTARMCLGIGPYTSTGGQLPAPRLFLTAAWRLKGCAPGLDGWGGGGSDRGPRSWNLWGGLPGKRVFAGVTRVRTLGFGWVVNSRTCVLVSGATLAE